MKPEFSPVRREERRQVVGQRGVHHQRHPPLGDGARLGQRQRDLVGGKGHGLGVEVAARDDPPWRVLQHQRVVGHGVGLDLQRAGGEAEEVQRRARHLGWQRMQ
jgi:hypothetical protein